MRIPVLKLPVIRRVAVAYVEHFHIILIRCLNQPVHRADKRISARDHKFPALLVNKVIDHVNDKQSLHISFFFFIHISHLILVYLIHFQIQKKQNIYATLLTKGFSLAGRPTLCISRILDGSSPTATISAVDILASNMPPTPRLS